MQPKPNIVHLPVYQPGKPIEDVKREFGLTEVIKLASNENPFGCSPKAKEAIIKEMDQITLYPDGASVILTEAVSRKFGVDPSQVIFGMGSDEIILMIARAFLCPGDESVMATHTFGQYKHNVQIEGGISIEVPLKNGVHDLPAMMDKVTSRTKIVWICNPNNPTGTMVTHQEIADFMAQVPEHVLVVLDEAYAEYNLTSDYPDGFQLIKEYRNLILLRTFSKIHGLASLRIGYGIGDPQVIRSINQVREPFNTSRFAQAAALASLGDDEFIAECRKNNAAGMAYLYGEFDRLGLSYFPSIANFIMVDVQKPAEEVFNGLLRRGMIVRGGHSLGFPTSLRVTIGSQEQNETFIRTLEEVLAEVAVRA